MICFLPFTPATPVADDGAGNKYVAGQLLAVFDSKVTDTEVSRIAQSAGLTVVAADTDDQAGEAHLTSVGSTVTGYDISSGTDVDVFSFTVTATAQTGYRFAGWSVTGASTLSDSSAAPPDFSRWTQVSW